MLGATFCFALMNVVVRLTDRIPVQEQVFFRSLITVVVIGAWLRFRGLSFAGRNRPLLVARGLSGTVALLAYFWTLHRMPLGTAVTLQHLSPIFTILFSALLLRESPRPIQIPFFLLAFGGVVLLRGVDTRVPLLDMGVGLFSAALSGLSYNLIRKLRSTDSPEVVVFWFPLVSLPFVGPWTVATWVNPSLLEWAGLLLVGLLTTFGQVFLSIGYQRSRAREVSALNFLGILFALLFGYLIFGEGLDPQGAAGVLTLVLGVALGTHLGRESSPRPGGV
jgi:drug/metabolite transporter (DMT)-like permease